MKSEKELDDYLKTIQGLSTWKLEHDLTDPVIGKIKEKVKDQNTTTQWLAAASVLICMLSGLLFLAGLKEKQALASYQLKEVSKMYAINNLNY
jgi:hypothetical protein